jgi:hypothetical protein
VLRHAVERRVNLAEGDRHPLGRRAVRILGEVRLRQPRRALTVHLQRRLQRQPVVPQIREVRVEGQRGVLVEGVTWDLLRDLPAKAAVIVKHVLGHHAPNERLLRVREGVEDDVIRVLRACRERAGEAQRQGAKPGVQGHVDGRNVGGLGGVHGEVPRDAERHSQCEVLQRADELGQHAAVAQPRARRGAEMLRTDADETPLQQRGPQGTESTHVCIVGGNEHQRRRGGFAHSLENDVHIEQASDVDEHVRGRVDVEALRRLQHDHRRLQIRVRLQIQQHPVCRRGFRFLRTHAAPRGGHDGCPLGYGRAEGQRFDRIVARGRCGVQHDHASDAGWEHILGKATAKVGQRCMNCGNAAPFYAAAPVTRLSPPNVTRGRIGRSPSGDQVGALQSPSARPPCPLHRHCWWPVGRRRPQTGPAGQRAARRRCARSRRGIS